MKPIRRLRLTHGGNIRDLGGYETDQGQVTRFGCLLRGGTLQKLEAEEWDRLRSYGVRTILDLRSSAEIAANPDGVPEGMEWYHCPMQKAQIDETDILVSAEKAFQGSLTEGYYGMLMQNGDLLAAAIKTLVASLEKGAVLFHCSAGKDRTGVLASSILYLCGISAEDIIADYEVSYTYNKRGMEKMLLLLEPAARENLLPYLCSNAENMEKQVTSYREVNLADYLGQYGLTGEEIRKLKQHFLY